MKLTIIGASAGIGLATVERALELGHQVTTLSRHRIEIKEDSNLTQLQGSALNKADLKRATESAEVVLVTLGTGTKTSATTLFSDFSRLLTSIEINIPVIVVTGFGASESYPYLTLMQKLFFKFILNKVYADKAVMERIITTSSLRWEIVRPGLLTDKPLTEKYHVETELHAKMSRNSISRNDVADFLVKEAVNQKFIGKRVALFGK